MVASFKQDWRMVNKNAIQHGVQAHLILGDIGLNAVCEVVVNRVLHVVWLEVIFESFLINLVIFKYFNHYVETTLVFICKHSNLKHSVTLSLIVTDLVMLICKDKI
jgi:hypothetical protein